MFIHIFKLYIWLSQDSNYSTYKRMWNAMSEWRPTVFTDDNEEGTILRL